MAKIKKRLKLILKVEGIKDNIVIDEEERIIKKIRRRILSFQIRFLEVKFENENLMINKDKIICWKIKR